MQGAGESKETSMAFRRMAFAALALLALWGCQADAQECASLRPMAFPRGELTIDTARGPQVFKIELAGNSDQRSRGLMCRTALGADEGMLFDFGYANEVGMWMKNTLIPLDMLFIREDGTIARVAARTVPHSEAVVSSGEPVLAVLELPGGTADRLGIKRGDKVRHALFKTATK
jgi:uncharacterized protein